MLVHLHPIHEGLHVGKQVKEKQDSPLNVQEHKSDVKGWIIQYHTGAEVK